jgi:hypothetical protein
VPDDDGNMKNQLNFMVAMICAFTFFIILLTGCFKLTPYTNFAPTVSDYNRSQRTVDQIELFLENWGPSKPYQVVGILDCNSKINDAWASLKLMREYAAKLGLDGVYDIHCAPLRTEGFGSCSGKGFVYKK